MKRRGFTFVELVVVLFLVSVLSLVLFPRLNVLESNRLRSAAEKVASDIRYAQQLAIRQSRVHGLYFEEPYNTQNKYWVFDQAISTYEKDPLEPTKDFIVRVDLDPYRVRFPHADAIDFPGGTLSPKNILTFDRRGIPYSDVAATRQLADTGGKVVIQNSSGAQRQITVIQRTGKVVIQ